MIILGHHYVTNLLAKMLIWAPLSQLMSTSFLYQPLAKQPFYHPPPPPPLAGDIIILRKCPINDNNMMYGS